MAEPIDFTPDAPIRCRDFRIGCIGAGFIMADIHLAAYHEARFAVAAIASRSRDKAAGVAERWNIPVVHDTPEALIDAGGFEILDIAYPPHQQPALIRQALAQPGIRAILAQKPLALDLATAEALVAEAKAAGKILSVNQNMRFDQSMRVLKQVLDRGALGTPVMASIDMRAIPHWQPFLRDYGRLTLLNMSIHHLDVLRHLFGEVEAISTTVRPDPRTEFAHQDGICISTLTFRSGVIALSLEDVWAGPRAKGYEGDIYIKWRVEGTAGIAQGSIGWPDYPNGSPSTFRYSSQVTTDGKWVEPTWTTRWFPQAFAGVMEQLQYALATDTHPALSAEDNLATMALIEAAYRSVSDQRTVKLSEFGY
ncbi:Gfo/Idh/MocA family oxidoreductase [Acidisoma cellulosilytica]|uniref:Gfo/Idh/MocA family oxidoreductase n=1 Tax=Acidisoma cellulosilyticum TaxID=2802395 RepID=A0A964E480_9PROT|nr:Gfo/Idh/MocA family oxidoreductase [Acidisoma cellulosilyticum]MCB8881191.1 Gfo/Idh/MocA family oxidoreductase [Acidisoma cellulosilyticum]